MRYVVYGAGAVGGVIGAHLIAAGADTTLVARGQHLAAIRKDGLRLDTPQRSSVVEAATASGAAEVAWDSDTVVLLCVKSQQTVAALEDLAGHAPPGTVVVSAQNGVANEREILRRNALTYAVCVMLPATHVEPGVVVQKCHPTPGILDLGRYPGGVDERAEAISADLERAGFVSVPRPDIMAWKYRKLIMNLGNGAQAAFRPGDAADDLVGRARAEGEAVLAAAGIPVVSDAEDKERRGDVLRGRKPGGPSGGSTWQSLHRATGSVEVDYLNGEIVLLGRLHGVPTPANELIQRTVNHLARTGGEVAELDAGELMARLP